MTSRAVRVWGRMQRVLSELTWRRLFQSGSHVWPTSTLASSSCWRCGGAQLLPPTTKGLEVRQRTLPIICQLEQHRSQNPLASWWGVHLSRTEEPLGWERGLRQGSPPIPGQCNHAEGPQSPSALQSVEGFTPIFPRQGGTRL